MIRVSRARGSGAAAEGGGEEGGGRDLPELLRGAHALAGLEGGPAQGTQTGST